jgi:hypothetical protein
LITALLILAFAKGHQWKKNWPIRNDYSSSKKEYRCIQIQVRTGQNIKYTHINKVKNGPPLL